jgi:hypothetical protein
VKCGGYKKEYRWLPYGDIEAATHVARRQKGSPGRLVVCLTMSLKVRTDVDQSEENDAKEDANDKSQLMYRVDAVSSELKKTASTTSASRRKDTANYQECLSMIQNPPAIPQPPINDTFPSEREHRGHDSNASNIRSATSTAAVAVTDSTAHGPESETVASPFSALETLLGFLTPEPPLPAELSPCSVVEAPPTSQPTYYTQYIDCTFDGISPIGIGSGNLDDNAVATDVLSVPENAQYFSSATTDCMEPSWRIETSQPLQGGLHSDAEEITERLYFPQDSPEILILRFDKTTCGTLSMVDGPTENPWRTLLWPLALESPALYHGVVAMAAFHHSYDVPDMRLVGQKHKASSIASLGQRDRISYSGDQDAIATMLVLALAKSFERPKEIGHAYIHEAGVTLEQAICHHQSHPLFGVEFARLKFLHSM